MPRKSVLSFIGIAVLLVGLVFSALPTGVVSADSGSTVSAAKLEQLSKAYLAQVKEYDYQKELLGYARERLEIVKGLQENYKETDAAYSTLQWYLNVLNTRIDNAEVALESAGHLIVEHPGFKTTGYGYQVRISEVTDLTKAEATIKSASEQVALSGKNLRRAMRLIKSAIKEFEE